METVTSSSTPARRLRPWNQPGSLGDVLARAEGAGILVYAKPDAPFEDVMIVDDGDHRVIVVLGDVAPALAALWIRWALSSEAQVA